ncbi:MAG TPA: DUF1761 domain-containing protein [Novosphingobium sp.]
MGPINWLAVGLAALLGAAAWLIRTRDFRPLGVFLALILSLLPAAMLGHALARIGADTLALKPKLYWMQSGGLAGFFVVPALLLTARRDGLAWGPALREAGYWLAVYLAMGTLFWALG